MNAMDRIKRAKVSIMRHPRFCAFSGVMSCGTTTVDASINPPTARTNGLDYVYHPDFVSMLSDQQLRLLILHETLHVAGKHLHMWKGLWKRNPQLANIAADHFVNLALMDMDKGENFLAMPEIGIQPEPKYRGWNIEQIFNDLLQNPPPKRGKGGGDGDGKGDAGLDGHDWENSEVTEEQAREIDRALRQGEMLARKRGNGAGNADGVIGDLLAPKVDWRDQLREFVQEQCQGRDESTWRKPNRRYLSSDVYMPSAISETIGPLVIGLDTSGSCFSGDTVTRFVSELKSVVDSVQPESVRVICWDWEVRTDQTFDSGAFDVPSLKIRGGGGTRGDVLFEHLAKTPGTKPSAIIQFTDGEFSWPQDCGIPTLWVLTEKHVAPWGRSIFL